MTRELNLLAFLALFGSIIWRNPLLFLLAVLLGLVAGLTRLWERYAFVNVTYSRRLGDERLFVGEGTDLTLEIVNAKPLPLAWLRIEDEFPGELELAKGKLLYSHKPERRLLPLLVSMRFYERLRKHYHVHAHHRGVLEFGPAEMSSGDIFGFRDQTVPLDHVDRLIVYPKVVPVAALRLPAEHPFGESKTARRISDDPLRLAGVRPYAPGDNPKTMHWKATARRGELQTKVFDPGATRTAAVFLDLHTVRGFPGVVPEYLEFAISAAASVARYVLDQREAMGLYTNGSRKRESALVRRPPSRRPSQWMDILEDMAWLSGVASALIEDVLRVELTSLPPGASVIVVSASADETMLAALLDGKRAGHPITLLTIGEEPLSQVAPPGIQVHWLGGRDAWQSLSELRPEGGMV